MRWLFLCALLAGCPDRNLAELPPNQVGQLQKDIPTSADLDVLFVIDNSSSTQDKQTLFTTNFQHLTDALKDASGNLPNIHLGVVTTTVDIGVPGFGPCSGAGLEDGRLQHTLTGASCGTLNGNFISDVATPTGRQQNYSGAPIESVFACMATVGTTGCGFEAPLEAMKRALDGSRPENAGFLRPGAFLAVVILTDEDDASVKDKAIFSLPADQVGPGDFRAQPQFAYRCDQPISHTMPGTYTNCSVRTDSYLQDPAVYVQFLETLRPGRAVVAVIAGDPKADISTGPIPLPNAPSLELQQSCSMMIGASVAIGRPGIRLDDFRQQFADNGLFRSVCTADYQPILTDIGKLIAGFVSPCLDGKLDATDIDPNNPGLQPDCTVSDLTNVDSPDPADTPMPTCEMSAPNTPSATGARPCWWMEQSPAACPTTASHMELHVERVNNQPAPPGTTVRVRCAAN